MKNSKNVTSNNIRYACDIPQKYKSGSVIKIERQKRLTGNWYIPKWLLDILQGIIVKVFTLYHSLQYIFAFSKDYKQIFGAKKFKIIEYPPCSFHLAMCKF